MRIESLYGLKEQIVAEATRAFIERQGDDEFAHVEARSTEARYPEDLALGVMRDGDQPDAFKIAVRTSDRAAAEQIARRASGEADIRIFPQGIAKRRTPADLQGVVDPLEPGAQIQIRGTNFVGTAGALVEDERGFYILTNSHVAADEGRTPIGTTIGQPFGSRPIGVLDRFVPFTREGNLVDVALVRLASTRFLAPFSAALPGNLVGSREITLDDLGRPVAKIGRTTGRKVGRITAVEVDGLPVSYDSGVLRFNDQIEISGGPGVDFSAGGDSGSLIVDSEGWAVALLFAGGIDENGEDHTYANRVTLALQRTGVALALVAP